MTRISTPLTISIFGLLALACSSGPKPTDKPAEASTAPASATPAVKLDDSGALIRFAYKSGEITDLCMANIKKAQGAIDAVPQMTTGKNTQLLAFELALADLGDAANPLSFMSSVSTDAKLRAESEECQKKLNEFSIGIFARRDLYDAIRNSTAETPHEQRLKKETLIAFEKQGLKLPDATVAEVKTLMQKLADMKTTFQTNLDNDKTTVTFTEAELEGTPADFRARLKKDAAGNFIVTTKYPDYFAVMENAKKPETRKKMMTAFDNRQAEPNTKLLEEAILIRQQLAEKLGFASWADYTIKGRMAKDAKEVSDFLNNLRTKLAKAAKSDLAKLLKLKKQMEPGATALNAWDLRYYEYQLKKKDYSLDNEKIREYFPAEHVIKNTFRVYSTLLGVTYVEVPNAKVWSPDVKLFEIRDTATNKLISYFYADLVPRDGKFGHAAAFQLISGRMMGKDYNKPISSIVANFEPPSENKPSLLTHDEVETFFHEFGHIMHQTLTRAPFASLAGSNVYQDFVEAPSQMLENWVWDKQILSQLSGHYKDTTKKLPDGLLKKMIQVRYFNKGYFYTRQLMLGLFDMTIHTAKGKVDSKKVYDDLYRELIGVEPLAENHFPATFGHMMGGYDAGYYGYLWSEVYAMDMFSNFQKEGLLNARTGLGYRKAILESGDMEEPSILLTRFLGRKPTSQAFIKMIETQIR